MLFRFCEIVSQFQLAEVFQEEVIYSLRGYSSLADLVLSISPQRLPKFLEGVYLGDLVSIVCLPRGGLLFFVSARQACDVDVPRGCYLLCPFRWTSVRLLHPVIAIALESLPLKVFFPYLTLLLNEPPALICLIEVVIQGA